MKKESPVVIALDYSDEMDIPEVLYDIARHYGYKLKIGLELFAATGPHFVRQLARTHKVLLDLKFNDTPNTVAKACRIYTEMGVWGMTLHTSGCEGMLKAARKAAKEVNRNVKLFGVTVLTSNTQQDLRDIGIDKNISDVVMERTALAVGCKLDGVVCAGEDLPRIQESRNYFGKRIKTLVPGIQLVSGKIQSGQARPTLLADAIRMGASYVVLGRALTDTDNDNELELLDRVKAIEKWILQ